MYSNPGPVQKKCGGPTGARRNFCKGEQGGVGDRSPPAVSRGGAPVEVWGAKPPEADGILLKMTYTDIAFLMWGPHFCGGPCSAEHAEHA